MSSVDRVLALMKDTFGPAGKNRRFKVYYDGDPIAIPLFNLPALVVELVEDDTNEAAYGQDDIEERFLIKVVFNKSDDFDGDLVNPLDMTAKKIREIIGKIAPDTKTYAKATVKYALRKHLTDGETALAPRMQVKYGVTPREAGEGYAKLTAEGHVSFSITTSRNTDDLTV